MGPRVPLRGPEDDDQLVRDGPHRHDLWDQVDHLCGAPKNAGMMISRLVACLAFGCLIGAASFVHAAPACDVAGLTSGAKLNDLLSKRAIEVIEQAAKPGAKADAALAKRVEPDATFMLGAGDLGRELGTGPAGARELAKAMTANLFMRDGWDYMEVPVENPCAEQKVVVEFLDSRIKRRCRITFTFVNGRVTAAEGWERSYITGPVTSPK